MDKKNKVSNVTDWSLTVAAVFAAHDGNCEIN